MKCYWNGQLSFFSILPILILSIIIYSTESHASRVLFIGNSFIGFAEPVLKQFQAPGDEFSFQFVGGTNLDAHTIREQTLRDLQCNRYDYVVLQDHSLRVFIDTNSFYYGLKTLSELTRASGAEPIFFETWARGTGGSFVNYLNDQNIVSNSYHQAGLENSVHTANIGDVWRSIYETNRSLFNSLYQSDGIHQSLAGNYIIATSLYSVIAPSHLDSAPTLGLSVASRDIMRGFSQSLNSAIIPHSNPNQDSVCDVESDSDIRARCGCPVIMQTINLAPIINFLLD